MTQPDDAAATGHDDAHVESAVRAGGFDLTVDYPTAPMVQGAAASGRRGRVVAWTLVGVVAVVVVVAAVIGAVLVIPSGPRTTVTLSASSGSGQPPSPEALAAAREILTKRLDGAGFDDPDVTVTATGLVATVSGAHTDDDFARVLAPAQVRFRKVIDVTLDLPRDPAPQSDPAPGDDPVLQTVLAKLGSAATVAQALQSPADLAEEPTLLVSLEPFGGLTPAEVAVLPAAMQFIVPQITCDTLNRRALGSIQAPDQIAVACEEDGHTKYLLDVAKVVGTDVASAAADADTTSGGAWKVDLTFDDAGAAKWSALTREAYNNEGGACKATQPSQQGFGNVCQVAIVLDTTVISAPAIQGVLASQAAITGGFTRASAELLAAQIAHGSLPLVLLVQSITTE